MTRAPIDPARCKARVWDRQVWSRDFQCNRKHVRDGYCAQHHPDAEAARRAKSDAKWKAESEAVEKRAAAIKFGAHAARFHAALKAIADGHNDPRAVAREAIEGIDPP